MDKSLDNRGFSGAVLMDTRYLIYDLLIVKLDAYGFSKQSLKLLYRDLTKRWQWTKVNTCFSLWTELLKGVP